MTPDHRRTTDAFAQLSESQIDAGLARLFDAVVGLEGIGGNVIVLPTS